MPRYFLHIRDTRGGAEDDEGVEVANLAEANESAVAGIRAMLSDEMRKGTVNFDGRIDIANDVGKILLAVRFADAVRITGL
jgi:hypothetical protein